MLLPLLLCYYQMPICIHHLVHCCAWCLSDHYCLLPAVILCIRLKFKVEHVDDCCSVVIMWKIWSVRKWLSFCVCSLLHRSSPYYITADDNNKWMNEWKWRKNCKRSVTKSVDFCFVAILIGAASMLGEHWAYSVCCFHLHNQIEFLENFPALAIFQRVVAFSTVNLLAPTSTNQPLPPSPKKAVIRIKIVKMKTSYYYHHFCIENMLVKGLSTIRFHMLISSLTSSILRNESIIIIIMDAKNFFIELLWVRSFFFSFFVCRPNYSFSYSFIH